MAIAVGEYLYDGHVYRKSKVSEEEKGDFVEGALLEEECDDGEEEEYEEYVEEVERKEEEEGNSDDPDVVKSGHSDIIVTEDEAEKIDFSSILITRMFLGAD